MFILDTNVLSELMKPQPDASVARWTSLQSKERTFTTAISKAEILAGLVVMPIGRRRTAFEAAVDKVFKLFDDRVLAFDEDAVAAFAQIVPARRAAGRPIGLPDLMIASIVRARNATVVTRDIGGFEHAGIPIINPWDLQPT